MKSITFTCEVITPMFLAGADGSTPELRPASIKGALRFWWRAMNGHLGLAELKRKEAEIFGGTEGSGRSKVLIRVEPIKVQESVEILVPHKEFMKQKAFRPKATVFRVILKLTQEVEGFSIEHLKSLFQLTVTLGGFGKRSRRGMGSVDIIEPELNLKKMTEILTHLQKFSNYFSIQGDTIYHTFQGRLELYPCIRQIQIGRPEQTTNTLLQKISYKTHEWHERNHWQYEATIGTARGGRFASPVYISILKGSALPIVTTLNVAPNKNKDQVSGTLLENFKNAILK